MELMAEEMSRMARILYVKRVIHKWEKGMIRDSYGKPIDCYWNQMSREEIAKMQESIRVHELSAKFGL